MSPSNASEGGGGGPGGSRGFKKRAWVTAEDNLLKHLVETHGPKDWNQISAQLVGRSAKQCCERCVRPVGYACCGFSELELRPPTISE